MRDFIVSIGSNRRLAAGILAETTAEARSAETTSDPNLKWWTTSYSIGTILPENCRSGNHSGWLLSRPGLSRTHLIL